MNVYGVILEIAKQELVQKPYIMLCSWKKCLSALKTFSEFSTVFNVDDYYRQFLQQIEMLSNLFNQTQQIGMKGMH